MNKRCFVIGNGPTLNKLDITKLKSETTFGCNRIYLKEVEMGFGVTNYFEIDSLEVFQIKEEINNYIQNSDIENVFTLKRFEENFKTEKLHTIDTDDIPFEYSNTGVVMCWKAIEMGYNPIYIVGMDLDYSSLDGNVTLIGNNIYKLKEGIEDNCHFDSDYWKGANEKFICYGEETVFLFKAFNDLKEYAINKKVEILNAGVNGKADMFERVDYDLILMN